MVKVDCLVRKDTEYRREEFRRRRRVAVEGMRLYIVTPEDLIISKLEWARDSRSPTQLNLLAAAPDLDRDYLSTWMSRHGLATLYREVVDA